MLNPECFITANAYSSRIRLTYEKGEIVFRSSYKVFGGKMIQTILMYANLILRQHNTKGIPVRFIFADGIQFVDKLMYVLFECICYQLIQEEHPVHVQLRPECQIITHGLSSSPLLLLATNQKKHIDKFCEKFHKEFYQNHFRQTLSADGDIEQLSVLMGDIATFQRYFDIKDERREKIAEVLTELVGNAMEHTKTACLIDFDVTPKHIKNGVDGKDFVGINTVILNFSQSLLGSALQRKIESNGELTGRHQLVQQAHHAHEVFFDEAYLCEDFYNVATFQHKISGRPGIMATGGTGLTKLIQSLEEDADAYQCYVISGQRQLKFQKEYMEYNEENWIGFNDTNDFLGAPPKKELLGNVPFFFPGTAYNLTLVMEVT